jgi:hypothetical protein
MLLPTQAIDAIIDQLKEKQGLPDCLHFILQQK